MEQPFDVKETVYYAAVFAVAFLAGVAQTLRGRDYVGCRDAFNIGLCAGFLAFAIVAFVDGNSVDRDGHEFFYLGVAALVGLSVKYQDQLVRSVWKRFASNFGIGLEDSPGDVNTNHAPPVEYHDNPPKDGPI